MSITTNRFTDDFSNSISPVGQAPRLSPKSSPAKHTSNLSPNIATPIPHKQTTHQSPIPPQSSAQCPLPNAPLPHSLLQDFLDGTLGLCQLAELHNLTLQQLEQWLESPQTQQQLASIEKVAAAREIAITAQSRVAAITTMTDIARSDAPAETRRKAAAMILKAKPHPKIPTPQDTTAKHHPKLSTPGSRAQSQCRVPTTRATDLFLQVSVSNQPTKTTSRMPRLVRPRKAVPAQCWHPDKSPASIMIFIGRPDAPLVDKQPPVAACGVEPTGPVAYRCGPSLRSSPHRVSENIDCSPRRIAAWSIGMKKDIHPTFYPSCKVFHNGEVVMTIGATVPELHVDVWSGSHPFFTGKSQFVDAAGRVEKFQRKFAGNYFQKKAK